MSDRRAFNGLLRYASRLLARPWSAMSLSDAGLTDYGRVGTGLLLDRRGRYQSELFQVLGDDGFAYHRHPHVRSLEVLLTGKLTFLVNGQGLEPTARLGESTFSLRRSAIPIGPDDWHSASTHGPCAFLSIQEWVGAEPSSVTIDWQGAPLSVEQERIWCDRGLTVSRELPEALK